MESSPCSWIGTNTFQIALESFARERGHRVEELAIAWLLAKPWVSTVIAGATKADQVTANVNAGQWKLAPEDVTQIDAL